MFSNGKIRQRIIMPSKKLNCWEFMKCGRGPEESRARNQEPCPAAAEKRLDTVHGGRRSGRACWVVAGTYCGGTIQGTFAQKQLACQRCDFYQKVHREEGDSIQNNKSLRQRLKGPSARIDITSKRLGVLLGGSGLVGGALIHHFKNPLTGDIEVLAPNSAKLSLREPIDIKQYFEKYQPDFIVNCAIAPIDSDAQMAYEINYLGTLRLARMAIAHKIPYIHFSSSATMPMGENLSEESQLELNAKMSNYAKSKLMAERTLAHLHETQGLDYTTIRLGVVYGKHDHKIQGFHRMLFSIADQSMPYILSRPGVCHSYSHAKKVPPFVSHILDHREEFSGQAYNFVDREPVDLVSLIKTIKKELAVPLPRTIYIPYPLANAGRSVLRWFMRRLGGFGVQVRLPAELIFMKNFYRSQTLLTRKLEASSYVDPMPDISVFSELPSMIDYYLTRWRQFNALSTQIREYHDRTRPAGRFDATPLELLDAIHRSTSLPDDEFDERFQGERLRTED